MAERPWYMFEEWQPPGLRQLGDDARMVDQLRAWTRGAPLTPGLEHQPTDEGQSGTLIISYGDEHRPSWAIRARQRVTDRDVAVYGYSSLTSALEDCLEMARSYEAEDLAYVALVGLA